MRSMLKYIKGYEVQAVLAPLLKMMEASFELIVPIVMKWIIDIGISNGDQTYILHKGALIVLLGVIGLICSVTAQYFAARAAVGFSTKLRQQLFEHIESLGFSEMDSVGIPTLMTRMTGDVNQVQAGLNMLLRLFMRSPVIIIGAIFLSFSIDVPSALVFLGSTVVLAVAIFMIMYTGVPLYRKVQGHLDLILTLARENLTGARVIRAFNKQKEMAATFKREHDTLTDMQLYVGRIMASMGPLTYVMVNIGTILILWVGGVRVQSGDLTTGAVVALVSYMAQILIELIKLSNLIINLTRGIAGGKRVEAIFAIEPKMKKNTPEKSEPDTDISDTDISDTETYDTATSKPAAPDAAHVRFDHVSLSYYDDGEEALSDISFSAKSGETIGIIGGTGSGKSSLVNLIPRFYDATEGCVSIRGKDVREWPLTDLRACIGMVMQRSVLFKGTVRENLKWGNSAATDEALWEALRLAQAETFVREKKGGLDAAVEQGGRNLSGGQKQRLCIARALVRKPEILILDDSASALDYATDLRLRSALAGLEYKPTIFIVAQRTSAVRGADQILVLDNGAVVGMGKHDVLLETCPLYSEIDRSQRGGADANL